MDFTIDIEELLTFGLVFYKWSKLAYNNPLCLANKQAQTFYEEFSNSRITSQSKNS